jgi:hypothetical protein
MLAPENVGTQAPVGRQPPDQRPRWPFVAVAVVGVLAVATAVLVTVLLTRSPRPASSNSSIAGTSTSAPGSTPPSSSDSVTATSSGAGSGSAPQSWDGIAAAQAPLTAPDGVDGAGNPTTYTAANMLDGDPATAWRAGGDETGIVLTFTLDQPRPITALALVNGYAKVDSGTGADRYTQERRILGVSWAVGGQVYQEQLADGDRGLQGIRIPATQATTVRLRIDAVTEPGDPNFDYTAISDVLIAGG